MNPKSVILVSSLSVLLAAEPVFADDELEVTMDIVEDMSEAEFFELKIGDIDDLESDELLARREEEERAEQAREERVAREEREDHEEREEPEKKAARVER